MSSGDTQALGSILASATSMDGFGVWHYSRQHANPPGLHKRSLPTMPYRMIAAALLLPALALGTATAVYAQSVADVDNALHAMELRMRAITAARKNLQQMEHSRHDLEGDAARDITDAETNVFTDAVKVFTVAYIVTGMKCPEDLRFAQKQFGSVVASFVTTADTELSRIDDNLRNVAAPAAHAEAVNLRDLIVDLRDFLKPFAVKG
jgi:uncharacterized protein HemX